MKKKSFTLRMPEDLLKKYTDIAIKQSQKEKRIIPLCEIIIKSLEKQLEKNEK